MRSLSFTCLLVAPLAACDLGDRAVTGECPRGEVCSDDTPHGLHFEGASFGDELLAFGPPPTLVGGTQNIRLTYDGNRTLDRPYIADDEGGAGVEVVSTNGPIVTLRGASRRTNYLRITDPEGALYDRKLLEGASLTSIRIVPMRPEVVAEGDAIVFVSGTQDFVVALTAELPGGGTARAADQSMTIASLGATRPGWDTLHLPGAALGHHAVAVTAAGLPEVAIDLEVVKGPDSLLAQAPQSPLVVGQGSLVCFSPRAAGRHVAGLAWTFTVDNGTATSTTGLLGNCASVTPAHTGVLNVTASAGGQVLTAPFTVAAHLTGPQARPATSRPSTAGERAAAF
jgi:hypothetical protein